jgi:hypothetical protein
MYVVYFSHRFLRWPRRAMTVNTRRFFTITLVVFFPSKLHSPFFSSELHATFFLRDDAIITRDVFSMQYYTRRFFNAIITRDVFPTITLAVFLELRFKLRVSLRTKMGAIIRLVCFIKTKNHVNTVHMHGQKSNLHITLKYGFCSNYVEVFNVMLPLGFS